MFKVKMFVFKFKKPTNQPTKITAETYVGKGISLTKMSPLFFHNRFQ